jgi:hypothetical protein
MDKEKQGDQESRCPACRGGDKAEVGNLANSDDVSPLASGAEAWRVARFLVVPDTITPWHTRQQREEFANCLDEAEAYHSIRQVSHNAIAPESAGCEGSEPLSSPMASLLHAKSIAQSALVHARMFAMTSCQHLRMLDFLSTSWRTLAK